MNVARFRMLASVVAIALLGASVAWSQPATKPAAKPPIKTPMIPDSVVVERDVEYGNAGNRPLVLDIVRPKADSAQPRPAIVFIHGGGWKGGNKASAIGSLLPFAASGNYFCATVGYRLSGEAIWPAQIHDCKAAIRWVKANAKKYNVDPDKIGVWGGSAGGHLVSLVGVTGGVAALEGKCGSPDQSSRVACVVDYCGPSDFLAIAKVKESGGRSAYGPMSELLGGPVEQKEAVAKEASPMTYVAKDVAAFLIVHGTADPIVPLDQAESFYAALKKAGADATLVKMEGGGHGIGGPEIAARVQAFFEKHLRGQAVEVSDKPIVVAPAKPKN